MESPKVKFNLAAIGKEMGAFVRSKAVQYGSFVIYEENGKIIRENPRTGKKTIIQPVEK